MGNLIELQLYITSGTPNSEQALTQLRIAMENLSPDHYRLEVVDLKK